jgi:hypothetical protein
MVRARAYGVRAKVGCGGLGRSVSRHRVAMELEHPEPCRPGPLRRVAGSWSAANEMLSSDPEKVAVLSGVHGLAGHVFSGSR